MTRTSVYRILGTITVLTLTACVTAEQKAAEMASAAQQLEATLTSEGWTRLDGAAVNAQVVDHTHGGVSEKGVRWKMYVAPSGTLRSTASGPDWGPESQTGTYTVAEDGLYCRSWSSWYDGEETCFRWFAKDGLVRSEAVSGRRPNSESPPYRPVPGNPQQL